jgi:hypothetical protein
MTLQVGMLASNGWVLASDERSTLQGGEWLRQTYNTDKILCLNGVATLAWVDECAMVARQKILDDLRPTPDIVATDEFQNAARECAKNVWRQHPGYQPEKVRGVVLASVGHKQIWHLAFGQEAFTQSNASKTVYGDPANPIVFFSEEFYKPERSVDELAFLAAHIVTAGAKYNSMVGGLRLIVWREGTDELKFLDASLFEARSKQFTTELNDLVLNRMRG